MAVTPEFLDYILGELKHAGSVRPKKMFGEVGLYAGDTFFAIVAEDVLYFKVDDLTRHRYVERGSEPFMPGPQLVSSGYFSVPLEVIEDNDELRVWMSDAIAAGRRKKRRKT